MTGVVPVSPRFKFFLASGAPAALGWVTVFEAGTTTKTNSWQDKAQGTLNTNPIHLDANGECLLWLDSTKAYKLLLQNSSLVTVTGWPVDNIPGVLDLATATAAVQSITDEAEAFALEAETYAAAAAAGAIIFYNTIAAGLAATASGTRFGVIAGGSDGLDRPTVYRDDAGVALLLYAIVPGSEFDAKLQEVDGSDNLYTPTHTGQFLNTDGTLLANASYQTSDYIEVPPNTVYSLYVAGIYATYNSSHTFLTWNSGLVFTTDATAAYVRVCFANADAHKILALGPYPEYAPTAYEAGISVPGLVLDDDDVKEKTVYLDQLKTDITVQARNLGFLTRDSENLFDKNQAVLNAQLASPTFGVYSGMILEDLTNTYFVTHLMAVAGSTSYKAYEIISYVQYDSDMVVVAYGGTGPAILTTHADAAFIRITVRMISLDVFMFAPTADYPTAYQEYDRFVIPPRIAYTNPWRGKKIVWMGHSVPAGAGYPQEIGENLFAEMVNIAFSGAIMCAFQSSGAMWGSHTNISHAFTLEAADVTTWAGANLGLKVSATNYSVLDAGGVTLTQAMLDDLVVQNYVALLVPHYDADLFVFDFGYNDQGNMGTLSAASGYDRRYFTGAIKYLWKKIYDYKASVGANFQAVIVSHHNRAYPATLANQLVNEQLDVASWLGVPCINLADNMGINDVNLLRYTDTVHFNAGDDLYNRYVTYITERLKQINP